ncbi:MAG: Hsp20/alpha crystallin family protein [Thaumarchaeota archaeon]|nr:Hsp20/alpha crystallin family protein [Candidatus Calditenuaceae archaeon]MDW8186644.1 archaeal heat shock protein Hsp20 [Nitrososphaerota archaeon]
MSEDYPPWWRRRWRPFELIDEMMREFERWFEEEFRRFERELPKDLVREVRTPTGVRREIGPIVYGYSITIGPDGRPIVREFGNVRPGRRGEPPMLKVEREPLVDVLDEEDKVRVVAEVPGVRKEDISLNVSDSKLVIRVETEQRRYYKEVDLPAEVDADNSKASYNNGVLEVTLPKKVAKRPARQIKVD